MARCPKCRDSREVIRVRRTGWRTYLRLIGYYPYHCLRCSKTFIGFGRTASKVPGPPIFTSSIPRKIQSKFRRLRRSLSSVKDWFTYARSLVTADREPGPTRVYLGKKAKLQIRQTFRSFAVLLLLDIIVGRTEYQSLG